MEGFLQKGQSVVVVEDLISTGGSSLQAVEALRNEGAVVKGMAAIFTYGFDVSVEKIKEANIDVYTLSNYDNLLKQAVYKKYINDAEFDALKEWRLSPSTWNVKV